MGSARKGSNPLGVALALASLICGNGAWCPSSMEAQLHVRHWAGLGLALFFSLPCLFNHFSPFSENRRGLACPFGLLGLPLLRPCFCVGGSPQAALHGVSAGRPGKKPLPLAPFIFVFCSFLFFGSVLSLAFFALCPDGRRGRRRRRKKEKQLQTCSMQVLNSYLLSLSLSLPATRCGQGHQRPSVASGLAQWPSWGHYKPI